MTAPNPLQYRTLPNNRFVNLLPEPAQVLLATLFWHRNRETGQCNPRHETLGRELGWSYSKVRDHIRNLREAGMIQAVKGKRGNRYEIRPHEEWRKAEKRSPCRPKTEPCPADRDQSRLARQEDFILNEQETIFLNKRSGVAASAVVGGGTPAALPEKAKTAPPPRCTKPAPTIPKRPSTRPDPILPSDPTPTFEEQYGPWICAGCGTPHKLGDPCPEPPVRDVASGLVDELMPQHPTAGNAAGAVRAIARLLATGADPESIRSSHARYRRLWAHFKPGRFVPQLWRWVQENDWRYPPDEKQIAAARDPEANREEERAKSRVEASRLAVEKSAREEQERERGHAEFRKLLAEGRVLSGRIA
jgi:hypothetical protein